MGKGRNTELIELRNKALYRRFYFWTEVQRLRYDDTFTILSREEFFLEETTIINILKKMIANPPPDDEDRPKVKVPRLKASQLELFQTHRK